MLTYDVNQKGNKKLYDFLYESIKNDILNGKIKSGEKLPSKRSFAKHLNVSVITVENAYGQLILEGYIKSIETKGYYAQKVYSFSNMNGSNFMEEKAEQKEHEYLVDFKANRVSHGMFPKATWAKLVREVLASDDEALLKTMPYNGLYVLRKAIAQYLLQCRGMKVSPGQIIIGAGTEYLYGQLLQLFGRESVFALEDPGYGKFAQITEKRGIGTTFVRIDQKGMNVDELRKTNANIVHISPSNHFPTGILMPISRRQELSRWAYEKENRYIIEDDYDCELRYSGKMIPPMYTLDGDQRIVYINTFSKSMVPSIRISYMVLPRELMKKYDETLKFYSCTVSSYEQYALALFISRGYFERHISRMKNYYKIIRKLVIREIKKSPLGKISTIDEQRAGTHFVLVVETSLEKEEIYRRAEEEDLYISLLSEYCKVPMEKMNKSLVINYAGVEKERIADAVQRLNNIFIK